MAMSDETKFREFFYNVPTKAARFFKKGDAGVTKMYGNYMKDVECTSNPDWKLVIKPLYLGNAL